MATEEIVHEFKIHTDNKRIFMHLSGIVMKILGEGEAGLEDMTETCKKQLLREYGYHKARREYISDHGPGVTKPTRETLLIEIFEKVLSRTDESEWELPEDATHVRFRMCISENKTTISMKMKIPISYQKAGVTPKPKDDYNYERSLTKYSYCK